MPVMVVEACRSRDRVAVQGCAGPRCRMMPDGLRQRESRVAEGCDRAGLAIVPVPPGRATAEARGRRR